MCRKFRAIGKRPFLQFDESEIRGIHPLRFIYFNYLCSDFLCHKTPRTILKTKFEDSIEWELQICTNGYVAVDLWKTLMQCATDGMELLKVLHFVMNPNFAFFF